MRSPKNIVINGNNLEQILANHKRWLCKNSDSSKNMPAYLCDADLHGADLHGADLRDANLCDADLHGADLRGADLRGANLHSADLRGSNLHGADLCGANLHSTDLYDANLYGADLRGAYLYGADLCGAKGNLIEYRKGKILSEDIIGYKKCKDNKIITLKIPRGSIVFSINGDRCRTNKAIVVDIDNADRAYSTYKYTSYYVGDEFTIYDFNCEYNVECAEGIHFFMTREEAENH